MKKNILIFSAVIITLMLVAFSVIHLSNSEDNELEILESESVAMSTSTTDKMTNRIFTDFIYDIGPRFNPIKKTDLDTLRSFNGIIGQEHAQRITAYKSVSVIMIVNDEQSNIRVTGNSDEFTDAQLELLQSSNYSTNLMVWADYTEKNPETGKLEDSHWTPYLTIVPEKQAEYLLGKDALMQYLKENSEGARTNVIAEKLKPAKLYFTVTKNGTIEHVRLDRSSNYPDVDKRMIELITNLSGKWESAKNQEGEKVDQELVISFGLMGC